MNVPEGFKQTEVGLIPKDWDVKSIGEICSIHVGRDLKEKIFSETTDRNYKYPVFSNTVSDYGLYGFYSEPEYIGESLTVVGRGVGLGKAFYRHGGYGAIGRLLVLFPDDRADAQYLTEYINLFISIFFESSGIPQLTGISFSKYRVALPPTRAEQTAIAAALSDMDALIEGVEKLLEKKRRIKQGAMQELLRPKEGWKSKTLACLTDCLDSLRIPLNESQRTKMKGDIPYCGANGIVDYINNYLIDDEIILMAEDGGFFDEYDTRPIAYKISGKCWVNNHAHILKAKHEYDQNFIFYSLVHKNIQNSLSSGTRSKLTKGEMSMIEITTPDSKVTQMEISQILSDMDSEIQQLETQLAKYRQLKTGMMQELLTGKKRLV